MTYTKQILAMLRDGDFAHPGEIEAIDLALGPMVKQLSTRILDVGCGLGGTANYVQQQGWGRVTGVDLDVSMIDYAKSHYPDATFVHNDILQAASFLEASFQMIYCFSAFFCFTSQQEVLRQLSQVATDGCDLILFDYSRQSQSYTANPFPWSKTASRFYPIYLPELKKQFSETGWTFQESIDITPQFSRWYTELLQKFDTKREEVIAAFDELSFNRMREGYQLLLREINDGEVGGIIVYGKCEK